MAGRLILCSLLRPKPPNCEDYLAAVRSFSTKGAPGWTWDPIWEELGPPWPLLRRYLNWRRHGAWPRRWPEFAPEYRLWMQQRGCARAIAELAKLLDMGHRVALGCWCLHGRHCHRALIGEFLESRGYTVEEVHW